MIVLSGSILTSAAPFPNPKAILSFELPLSLAPNFKSLSLLAEEPLARPLISVSLEPEDCLPLPNLMSSLLAEVPLTLAV